MLTIHYKFEDEFAKVQAFAEQEMLELQTSAPMQKRDYTTSFSV